MSIIGTLVVLCTSFQVYLSAAQSVYTIGPMFALNLPNLDTFPDLTDAYVEGEVTASLPVGSGSCSFTRGTSDTGMLYH